MPVHVRWDDPEHTIIYVRYEGRWTWEEFYQAVHDTQELSATVDHRIDVIAHMLDGFIPHGAPFAHSQNALKQKDARLGRVVVVSDNRFVQGIMQVSARVNPRWKEKYSTATSVEEARSLIQKDRMASGDRQQIPK
jgi:hypothetical protein